MMNNNWIKELLKLLTIAIQVYIESSSKLHNIESYIKKSAKYLISLVIIAIPILLTIWGGLFLSLFFYITGKYGLNTYTAALVITLINIFILIVCLTWFKHKIRKNKLQKNNINLLFIELVQFIKSINKD